MGGPMIEVYVSGMAFDTLSKAPVVLLKEIEGPRVLPIWIGPNEAAVIALELSGVKYRRPLTHDLLKSVIDGFSAKVQKIVISSLIDNTYYARFYILAAENSIVEIDARPSDSIAMALKMTAPIFVSDELNASFVDLLNSETQGENADGIFDDSMDLRKRLRNIKPDDLTDFNG
jgi:uncharacterized protein